MSAERVDALVRYFETLTPESLDALPDHYAADCRFVDPFNDVVGRARVEAIFRHMFAQLDTPRFIVRERVVGGARVLLTWDFEFAFRRWRRDERQRIHGASLITFDADGLVTLHRDYWDAADLYGLLPLVGPLLRWLQRQGRPKAP